MHITDLRVELPVVALGGVRPEVALVDRDEQSAVEHELRKEAAHPHSLLIERWVSVTEVCRVQMSVVEVILLPKDFLDVVEAQRLLLGLGEGDVVLHRLQSELVDAVQLKVVPHRLMHHRVLLPKESAFWQEALFIHELTILQPVEQGEQLLLEDIGGFVHLPDIHF